MNPRVDPLSRTGLALACVGATALFAPLASAQVAPAAPSAPEATISVTAAPAPAVAPPVVIAAPPPAWGQPPPGALVYPAPVVPPFAGYAPGYVRTPYHGEPIPPGGYVVAAPINRGLLVGGAVMFGVPWLVSSFAGFIGAAFESYCSYGSCAGTGPAVSWEWLALPVLGPWLMLGNSVNAPEGAVLVLDGLLQAGGIAMVIASIAARGRLLVSPAPATGPGVSRPVQWGLAPMRTATGMGLALSLTHF